MFWVENLKSIVAINNFMSTIRMQIFAMEFEIVIEEAVIESIYMHPLGGYKWSKGTAKDKWYTLY
jgi:hypothetical protein